MINLAILGSTRGTNLLGLIDAIHKQTLPAQIEIVLSNKPQAGILARAKQYNIPSQYVDPANLTREDYDEKINQVLQHYHIDLLVLIGYMRIISADFLSTWQQRIINVHPSLLPAFSGLIDLQVHQAVINSGAKISGCTVHEVTPVVDAGPILIQKSCPVFSADTPEILKARVQQLEVPALIEAITLFAAQHAREQ